jgi:Viral BACON domain
VSWEADVLTVKSRCLTVFVALAIALSASDTSVAPMSGAGRCSYTLWPPSLSFSGAGGRSSVSVTTADYCTWIVSADLGWISIVSPASGTGESTIDVSVGANPSARVRTGTLKIGGEIVSVRQEGKETCPNGVSRGGAID